MPYCQNCGTKNEEGRKSVSTVENPCMTRVAGALAVMGAMGSNARNRNALDSPTAVSSSEYSSVRFF